MSATMTETTATVKRGRRGKQEDLPGVEVSSRKIAEIEDLADVLVEAQDRQSIVKGHVDDAMENLVASMRRHKKTYYSRPTFGTVTLKEAKIKAKVDKSDRGADDEEPDDAEGFLKEKSVKVSDSKESAE